MSHHEDHYDTKKKIYWLFRVYDDAHTLVPTKELHKWSEIARNGKTIDGLEVNAVNYVFANEETAEYNHPANEFAKVGTYVGTVTDATSFAGDESYSFDAREDFGIS